MNAVQSFFAKYHAVPADDLGVDWSKATDAALLGWAADDCRLWDASPAARPGLAARMFEIAVEIEVRRHREWETRAAAAEYTPPTGWASAGRRITDRIGRLVDVIDTASKRK